MHEHRANKKCYFTSLKEKPLVSVIGAKTPPKYVNFYPEQAAYLRDGVVDVDGGNF